jgi:hypothetical protein
MLSGWGGLSGVFLESLNVERSRGLEDEHPK